MIVGSRTMLTRKLFVRYHFIREVFLVWPNNDFWPSYGLIVLGPRWGEIPQLVPIWKKNFHLRSSWTVKQSCSLGIIYNRSVFILAKKSKMTKLWPHRPATGLG